MFAHDVSSLGNTTINNALQIKEILKERAEKAFKENVIQSGVIEKCSAYAAREHGDVRRAIDLLRVAGEIAERSGSLSLEIVHLDEAEKKVEADKILNAVINQPKQFQNVLYSIMLISPQKNQFYTGEIYEVYKNICKQTKFNILTQRRVSDILAEMDMLGIINAKIISKGRYGRTREVSLSLEENLLAKLKEVLEKIKSSEEELKFINKSLEEFIKLLRSCINPLLLERKIEQSSAKLFDEYIREILPTLDPLRKTKLLDYIGDLSRSSPTTKT